jgi:hypothetical protein
VVRVSVIGLLLGEGGIARAASPHSATLQKIVELDQRRQRCPRRPDVHPNAAGRVEHPGRHHRHDAGRHLDADEPARGPVLAMLGPESTVVQRMPTAMNNDVLPDMGRMNG